MSSETLSLKNEINITSSTTNSATEPLSVQEETHDAPSTTELTAEFLGLGLPEWTKKMGKVLSSRKGDVQTGTIININSDQTVNVLWDGISRGSHVEYSVHVSYLEPFDLKAQKPTRKRKKISPYSPPRPGSPDHGLALSSTSSRSSSGKKKKAKSRSSPRGSGKDKKASSRMGKRRSSKQPEGGKSSEAESKVGLRVVKIYNGKRYYGKVVSTVPYYPKYVRVYYKATGDMDDIKIDEVESLAAAYMGAKLRESGSSEPDSKIGLRFAKMYDGELYYGTVISTVPFYPRLLRTYFEADNSKDDIMIDELDSLIAAYEAKEGAIESCGEEESSDEDSADGEDSDEDSVDEEDSDEDSADEEDSDEDDSDATNMEIEKVSKKAKSAAKPPAKPTSRPPGIMVPPPIRCDDVSCGQEMNPIAFRSSKTKEFSSFDMGFTYIGHSVRRDLLTDRVAKFESILAGSLFDGCIDDKQKFYDNLERDYYESKTAFERRKKIGLGEEQLTGCNKCVWSKKGCNRCNDPTFVMREHEGAFSSCPRPGSEFDCQKYTVYHPGYESNVVIDCAVTDETPICLRIKEAFPDAKPFGLIAMQDIKAGSFCMEYVGEILTAAQGELRDEYYDEKGFQDSYQLGCEVGKQCPVIDARIYGNAARFINQSCGPNVEFRSLKKLGQMFKNRNGIFALRNIKKGEELTIVYDVNGGGDKNEYA
eukprot:CAMPEP_0118639500 /NCGR_PEP_ID=MMETSP0785-20121206/4254_1 /TAXON_ID=91992 /ORGANISM="Bolidomonas pacifica, Strain CCMP 1866" /LENGTH=705 /DNA_ID=CAMNT_0006530827 /DNA_START=108 /DNA_END=2221 /DNA_ORIENTATION=+